MYVYFLHLVKFVRVGIICWTFQRQGCFPSVNYIFCEHAYHRKYEFYDSPCFCTHVSSVFKITSVKLFTHDSAFRCCIFPALLLICFYLSTFYDHEKNNIIYGVAENFLFCFNSAKITWKSLPVNVSYTELFLLVKKFYIFMKNLTIRTTENKIKLNKNVKKDCFFFIFTYLKP